MYSLYRLYDWQREPLLGIPPITTWVGSWSVPILFMTRTTVVFSSARSSGRRNSTPGRSTDSQSRPSFPLDRFPRRPSSTPHRSPLGYPRHALFSFGQDPSTSIIIGFEIPIAYERLQLECRRKTRVQAVIVVGLFGGKRSVGLSCVGDARRRHAHDHARLVRARTQLRPTRLGRKLYHMPRPNGLCRTLKTGQAGPPSNPGRRDRTIVIVT
jgi:hypothetical protein